LDTADRRNQNNEPPCDMRTSDCMSDTSPTGPQATRANFCAAFSAMSPLLDELRQFQFHAEAGSAGHPVCNEREARKRSRLRRVCRQDVCAPSL